MSDPRIAALRAKADSSTFPAEAAALRAKADELAAKEPQRPINGTRVTFEFYDELLGFRHSTVRVSDIMAKMAAAMKAADARREAAAGNPAAQARWYVFDPSNATETEWTGIVFTKVSSVNGRTYWIRTE